MFVVRMEASAKDGEGAGRGPCGLRKSLQGECRDGLHADRHDRTVATDAAGVNSELGPRPHDVLIALKKTDFWR